MLENVKQIQSIETQLIKYQKTVTIILFWAGLVVLCSLYVTIPLLPLFSTIFHISSSQAAWTGSTFSISFAVGCLFFGAIADRYGRKKVMVYGLLALSLMTFGVGVANHFGELILFRALQGMLAATFSPVALTYIGVMFPPNKRVTTIGIISSGFLTAGIIGQLISSFIMSHFHWSMVFYFFSIIYFITTILIYIFLPTDIMENQKNILLVMKKFIIPFKSRALVLCNIISIMILLSFVGMYTALGHYLGTEFDFNDQQIFYVRAGGLFGMCLSPFVGKFVQRFGMRKVLICGFMSSIIGVLSIGLTQHLLFIISMSVLFVCGICMIVPTMLALVGQLGAKERGIATSIYTFILFIGASIGPLIATHLLEIGSVTLPFSIFGCLLAVGLMITTFIPFKNHKNPSTH
jgi:MFS transporter, YNFM family, putative membrane transport protein